MLVKLFVITFNPGEAGIGWFPAIICFNMLKLHFAPWYYHTSIYYCTAELPAQRLGPFLLGPYAGLKQAG